MPSGWLVWLAGSVWLVLFVLLLGSSAHVLWQVHWPGVYIDMWDELPFLQRLEHGQSTWTDWLNAYALSHRLLLPRLVFAVEHLGFFHTNQFTLTVSLVAHALSCVSLAWWVKGDTHAGEFRRGVLWLLLGANFASALHLHNLLYPFLVQWFLVLALVLLAIQCLMLAVRASVPARRWQALAASWLLVVLASFCTASGTVALLVLAGFAVLLRLGNGGWVFAVACLLVLAAQVLSPTGNLPADVIWARMGVEQRMPDIASWLLFCLDFLGMPLTLVSPPGARFLGAVVLLYAAWQVWLLCRRGPGPYSPSVLICLMALAWLCVNAVAIGYGRAVFAGTATDARFHTLHVWPVSLLLMHALLLLPQGCRRGWRGVWYALPVIWVVAVLVPLQLPTLADNVQQANRVRLAHIAYSLDLRGLQTHPLLSVPHRMLGENPALDWRPYLKESGRGFFAHSMAHRPGRQLDLPDALPLCEAVVSWQRAGRGSLRFQIDFPVPQPVPQAAWVLDSERRVMGWASPEWSERLFAEPARLSGYVRQSGGPMQVVMENPWCRLPEAVMPGGQQ